MIALYIFIGFVILSIWAIVSDVKKEKRQHKEVQAKCKAWLEEELKKPLSKVMVVTKSGTTLYSESFEPKAEEEYYLNWNFFRRTSLEQAQQAIENSIRWGRYCDTKTNTYVPMCEVEVIRIVDEI
jgi:hypothetical protein